MTDLPPKKSELGVRTLSALVMLAVAGGALWLGGWWWTAFVVLMAAVVFYEWHSLVRAFAKGAIPLALWALAGVTYIGVSAYVLTYLRDTGLGIALSVIGAVIATDIGAYFFGRTIGGPKIAPRISPSKTWAGLIGGMIGSAAVWVAPQPWTMHDYDPANWWRLALVGILFGALVAVVAQAGDFFESWMKRRAGVKDSGNLIPGHGGLFDRVDGLLAVCFVLGLVFNAFSFTIDLR